MSGNKAIKAKKEEQARIARENDALFTRLATMGPTIDDNTEDDATGEARARLRAESASRRQRDAAVRTRRDYPSPYPFSSLHWPPHRDTYILIYTKITNK